MRVLSLAETTCVSGGMEEVTVTGKRINSTCNILIRQEIKELSGGGDIAGAGVLKLALQAEVKASAKTTEKTVDVKVNDLEACKGISVNTTNDGIRFQIP